MEKLNKKLAQESESPFHAYLLLGNTSSHLLKQAKIFASKILSGSEYFSIIGEFDIDKRSESIHCHYKIGEKKVIKRNSKIYKKLLLIKKQIYLL